MPERSILVCNAGSSSLKTELFAWPEGSPEPGPPLARATIESVGHGHAALVLGTGERQRLGRVADHGQAAEVALARLLEVAGATRIAASGHRLVHGGPRLAGPVRIDPAIEAELNALAALAPLHIPPALTVLRAVERRLPGVPSVAAFDTTFFRSLPEHARRYAVPERWREEHGIERFGFHGLAHECMYRRGLARGARSARVITLQLGHGCSAAALSRGEPIETSMGFTPLEGLIMATRSGDIDPGALLYLAARGEPWSAIEHALQTQSGLLGLAGETGDMRELLAREADGDPRATLAIAAFCHRLRKYIGGYAAVLGGLDTLAFGGGIGERSAAIRARVCEGFAWLGLALDPGANAAATGGDAQISAAHSAIDVRVVEVREEPLIAAAVATCLR